jgi:hypothetical protein
MGPEWAKNLSCLAIILHARRGGCWPDPAERYCPDDPHAIVWELFELFPQIDDASHQLGIAFRNNQGSPLATNRAMTERQIRVFQLVGNVLLYTPARFERFKTALSEVVESMLCEIPAVSGSAASPAVAAAPATTVTPTAMAVHEAGGPTGLLMAITRGEDETAYTVTARGKPVPGQTAADHIRSALLPEAFSSGGTERSEGVSLSCDDSSIVPCYLSATDIAKLLGRKRESVTTFLRRYAEQHPDCRTIVENRRKNEPAHLYRTVDVWPALKAWCEKNSND